MNILKKTFLITTMLTILTGAALAAGKPKKATATEADKKPAVELTAEQRQKMAEHHDKMAACLRSDKPVDECRKELMGNCEGMMGKGFCPLHKTHGKSGESCNHKEGGCCSEGHKCEHKAENKGDASGGHKCEHHEAMQNK